MSAYTFSLQICTFCPVTFSTIGTQFCKQCIFQPVRFFHDMFCADIFCPEMFCPCALLFTKGIMANSHCWSLFYVLLYSSVSVKFWAYLTHKEEVPHTNLHPFSSETCIVKPCANPQVYYSEALALIPVWLCKQTELLYKHLARINR
jgi:hypothetical protein